MAMFTIKNCHNISKQTSNDNYYYYYFAKVDNVRSHIESQLGHSKTKLSLDIKIEVPHGNMR